jgi:hypothetical protein
MGHAGTGLCMDNATILFNPGAMSFLDSLRGITIGASFIMPRTTYLEPFPGTYTAHIEKTRELLSLCMRFTNSKKQRSGMLV